MAGKPKRLGKAASELNVGLPTSVDFLLSKENKVDNNPNTREQFELRVKELINEFGVNFENNFQEEYETIDKEEVSKNDEPEIHTIPGFIIKNAEQKKPQINDFLSIGFSNFKRFGNFPKIDFRAINFFVGPNNAGKSTAVKAYRLVSENLKNLGEYFDLSGSWSENANRWSKDEKMIFEHNIGSYELKITLSKVEMGISQNDVYPARVHRLELLNTANNVNIRLFFLEGFLLIDLPKDEKVDNLITLKSLSSEINFLSQKIEKLGNLRNNEYFNLVDNKNKLISNFRNIKKATENKGSKDKTIQVFLNKSENIIDEYNLESISKLIVRNINLEIHILGKKIEELKKSNDDLVNYSIEYQEIEDIQIRISQLKEILEDKRLKNFFNDFKERVNSEEIIYLGANLTKQSPLFLIQDSENQLSQSIHNFTELKEIKSDTSGNDEAFQFLKKWMEAFEILSKDKNINEAIIDFEILPVHGIAYEFNLLLREKGQKTSLANMGMGSIQVMTLLLRLATLIRKSKKENKLYLVVVEEPELNLHPDFQAKLCDLFFEVNKEYPNIRFVIETHSEYMIRNSQLIVNKNEYKDESEIPFLVVYFDKLKGPNLMNYKLNGIFQNDFGPYFYDMASYQALKLLMSKKN